MVDFHTHILPEVDDGSQSMEESLAMLEMEKNQGVTEVIFSPHFYAHQMGIKSFLEKRMVAYQRVTKALEEKQWKLQTRLGAEVAFFRGMFEAEQIDDLCIEGTRVMLLEMPFEQWTEEMYLEVDRLINRKGFTIVLVHLERYPMFQRSKKIWKKLLELPVYTQFNGGAILNPKKRKRVLRLMKKRNQLLLGSDTHNLEQRKPNLESAREIIRQELGEEVLQKITQCEEQLLKV